MVLRAIACLYQEAYTGHSRGVWVMSVCMFICRCGRMVVPFLSLYVTESLHYSEKQAGQLISMYGLGGMIGSYMAGKLVRPYGAIRVQVTMMIIAVPICLLVPHCTTSWSITSSVLFLALFCEGIRPANATAIAKLSQPGQQARSFSLQRTFINCGMSLGPAVGGVLAMYSFTLLFVVDASCMLACALWMWYMLGLGQIVSPEATTGAYAVQDKAENERDCGDVEARSSIASCAQVSSHTDEIRRRRDAYDHSQSGGTNLGRDERDSSNGEDSLDKTNKIDIDGSNTAGNRSARAGAGEETLLDWGEIGIDKICTPVDVTQSADSCMGNPVNQTQQDVASGCGDDSYRKAHATGVVKGDIAYAPPHAQSSREQADSERVERVLLRTDATQQVRDRKPLRDPIFLTFLVLNFFTFMALFQLFSTLPLYARDMYGFSKRQTGALFSMNTVLVIVFEMVLTTWSQTLDPMLTIGAGSFLITWGFGVFAFVHHPFIIYLGCTVMTVGQMLATPIASGFVAHRSIGKHQGEYMGVRSIVDSVAFILAPLMGTYIYTIDHEAVWYCCLGAGVFVSLGYICLSVVLRSCSRISRDGSVDETAPLIGADETTPLMRS
ncbi:hypothetical protein SARC_11074 [Sphaeroforma arctica JP610]|uniref:Major facilitator superfamily (MFS) profile domain-containing protein n=1 Tax=Sphaeroforma arctica JP610 TaxID=667725 RepID=A0A0L0FK55_9EUKA|nr:hypothetical protein SARC_11074 [Sphaeroforma arctica JP610]KNC76423.1 hypothetical protein SARC_11074 [Sphaeroforma arctica JP610]|eukprot:XP_014150325.1 hypothetical protein SARC_11074 [Sphaeroforma arctica JP610]